jgi:hypothetical protein
MCKEVDTRKEITVGPLPIFIKDCVVGATWGNILPEKINERWVDQFGHPVTRESRGWFVKLSTYDNRTFYIACDLVKEYVGPHSLLDDGNWHITALAAMEIRDIASFMNIPKEVINDAIGHLRMTDTQRVHMSDHDALESFPRGRYYVRGGGVHLDGKPCGRDCPQRVIDSETKGGVK